MKRTRHSSLLSSLLVVLLIVSTCAGALADTIRLKNGSVIKGKVVGFANQEFTVLLDLGGSSKRSASRMVIAAEDIESIQFDGVEPAAMAQTSTQPSLPGSAPAEPQRNSSDATRAGAETSSVTTSGAGETSGESPAAGGQAAALLEKSVTVPASADWSSTEIRVQRGQRVTILASGEVDLGNNQRSTPAGLPVTDPRKLISGKPTGGLIAVIGDDNDDFEFIGRQGEFTARHTGILFLSVNESNLKDNSGAYTARVRLSGAR
ncbi:MAG: hypothetical protein ACKV2V_19100 [Blastocatellia bacterium]